MIRTEILKVFGRLVSSQSRDIRVLNYAKHQVFEIYDNQGFHYFSVDKKTGKGEHLQTTSHLNWDTEPQEYGGCCPKK
jgi:hypothetical protein